MASGPQSRTTYHRLSDGRWERKERATALEIPLTIFVNGQETVTLLCSPHQLNYLILGHLYFEGLIRESTEVASMIVCPDEPLAHVKLVSDNVVLPQPRVVLSGCGSGLAPASQAPPSQSLDSPLRVKSTSLVSLMSELHDRAEMYKTHGGVHSSALADPGALLLVAEDIGRHNTVDKIQGECLYKDISPKDRLLLTTGRLSSEMVDKAARMAVPLLVSRNSPTARAVAMADALNITLVGYVRGAQLSVYTHPERIEDLTTD